MLRAYVLGRFAVLGFGRHMLRAYAVRRFAALGCFTVLRRLAAANRRRHREVQ